MATWLIGSVNLASGIIGMRFTKDNGDASANTIIGDNVLSIGKGKRAIEESGYGGNLRIAEIDLELLDVGGTLKGEVFSTTNWGTGSDGEPGNGEVMIEITTNDGSDHNVFLGIVDLSTVEFESYFDDESSTERHKCRFTAFDILKRLERFRIGDVREALDASKVSYEQRAAIFNGSNRGQYAFNDTAPVSGQTWSNPYFVFSPDLQYASVTLGNGQHSFYLRIQNFGFEMPSTFTPDSIQVQVVRKRSYSGITGSSSSVRDKSVKIIKGGTVSGTDKADTAAWSLTAETKIYNPNFEDLWGTAFTYSDINASDFGVAISAENVSGFGNAIAMIDSVQITVHAKSATAGPFYFVKVVDVFRSIQSLLNLPVDATGFEDNVDQTFVRFVGDVDADNISGTFDDLYLQYKNPDETNIGLWNETVTGSFWDSKNVFEFLLNLSNNFLSAPIWIWDAANQEGHLKLKQRPVGSALSLTGAYLMASKNRSFQGYDGVKLTTSDGKQTLVFTFDNRYEDEYSIENANLLFDQLRHKFEFISFFKSRISSDGLSGDYNHLYLYNSGTGKMAAINFISDDSLADALPFFQHSRMDFLRWLAESYRFFWDSTAMYERQYSNTGLISPLVELLDKVTIGSAEYAVLEHSFDLINNEMNLKLVSY